MPLHKGFVALLLILSHAVNLVECWKYSRGPCFFKGNVLRSLNVSVANVLIFSIQVPLKLERIIEISYFQLEGELVMDYHDTKTAKSTVAWFCDQPPSIEVAIPRVPLYREGGLLTKLWSLYPDCTVSPLMVSVSPAWRVLVPILR